MRPLFICWILSFSVLIGKAQESGTVIVANMSDNTVMLFDAASRERVVTIPSGPAPHEITVSESGKWAIVTNYGNQQSIGSSLSLIDVPGAKLIQTIDLGIYQRPHGAVFLPGDSLVAVTSESMKMLLWVDVQRGEIVDTVSTTQRVSHMLAGDLSGAHLFTTNMVDGTITEFNGNERTRGRVLPVAPMVEGIGVSPDGSRVWVGSNAQKSVSVVDVESGKIEQVFTDFGFPYRIAVMPNGKYALMCDPGKSQIRVVDAHTLELVKTLNISGDGAAGSAEFSGSAAPEGIIITPNSRYAYVSLQGLNQVAAIDLEKLEIVGRFKAGVWPDGISYSPLQADVSAGQLN